MKEYDNPMNRVNKYSFISNLALVAPVDEVMLVSKVQRYPKICLNLV
jgi:hypothetical protein